MPNNSARIGSSSGGNDGGRDMGTMHGVTGASAAAAERTILTINAGSSSIRCAVYSVDEPLRRLLAAHVDRIGSTHATLNVPSATGQMRRSVRIAIADHRAAVAALLDWLEMQPVFSSVSAVGHRVVHGMTHSAPERVTPRLLAELHRITPYDPEHLRRELRIIEEVRRRHPAVPQVACFDTAFHRHMPQVARALPIPRRYASKGVVRYGFHGLSFAYLMEELGRVDARASKGRVILAHLGNGASLAAVRNGKSIDTSMGFTPTSGLMMSTRTGNLDPGVAYYLARTEHMTAAQFQRMVTRESGLLGVSRTSSDVRDLLAREATDARAVEALALFCYQAKKWIGSFAAALGGLDTLVFAGGIGENAPLIRQRICEGLGFLGIELHRRRNAANAPLISRDAGKVRVRVMRTDEELMIARSVVDVLRSC